MFYGYAALFPRQFQAHRSKSTLDGLSDASVFCLSLLFTHLAWRTSLLLGSLPQLCTFSR
ncbi:uncharacterized protein SPAR_D02450 [Saccharomyces paradoxus]|uniref:Uncharacterized protein n=1 Tax=Saccharomyces paradoxus TaxID=27291 RepID=A0A8B8UND8_SACPA|nr:uncharacterized protein SPAR_D02450 [Saccharomyces paradoxus]QHS72246.1 hypothetical protein SPAR_D02450 [Saccharomyces paradoxus]